MKARRLLAALTATAVALLASSANAGAQVTVGQIATEDNADLCSFTNPGDELITSVGAGQGYAVPAPGGLITSWSTASWIPNPEQKLGLKVFRPAGPNTFTAIGQDDRTLTPLAINTFPVSIPVQAGDLVALHVPSHTESPFNNCKLEDPGQINKFSYFEGNAALGTPTTFTEEYGENARLNVAATVLPPPTITSLTPAAGSVKGGGVVAIAGSNFAQVKSVSFGSTPGTAVSAASESQISATAPASATIGAVPVTVTTAAGTVTASTPFAYEGCRVPKLKGKKLKASKKKLKKSDCKTGKVKKKNGATAATGKVVAQKPKPGTIAAPGAKVKLTLAS